VDFAPASVSGLCFAQAATDGAGHSCCHQKNHCGHAAPAMQSHQPVAIPQIVPAVLTQPVLASSRWVATLGVLARTYFTDFSPALQTSVLRL
jgi:hypothetical protein